MLKWFRVWSTLEQAFRLKNDGSDTFSLLRVHVNAASHLSSALGFDAPLMSALTSVESLRLLPLLVQLAVKMGLVCFKCCRPKDHAITIQVCLFVCLKGPPISKHFLRALYQMERWNKSKGFGKRTICRARLLSNKTGLDTHKKRRVGQNVLIIPGCVVSSSCELVQFLFCRDRKLGRKVILQSLPC